MKFKYIFLSLLLFSFSLFTSCQNFFNGKSFAEELDQSILYSQSQTYTVRVAVEKGTGDLEAGGGDNPLKVSDSLTISFSPETGYKFIRWVAVQKDDETVSMEDYVQFKNSKSLETKLKLVKAPESDILVKPYCEETFAFTEVYPEDKTEGVARDSSIKLVLTSPLSEDNDLSKISITVDGSEVSAKNFKAPVLNGKEVIITADMDNKIPLNTAEIKKVTVTIPKEFTVTGKTGEKIPLEEDLVYSYKINSTTSKKAAITFIMEDKDAGVLKVNGNAAPETEEKYSIGETLDLSLKLNTGYSFTGWDYSDGAALYITYPDQKENADYNEIGFNKETLNAMATATIINESEAVTFTVKTKKLQGVKISGVGVSEYGTYTYTVDNTYYEGYGNNLGFGAYSDYQFVCWQIWDKNANNGKGAEIQNKTYITIADPWSSNTSFTLSKAPKTEDNIALMIIPVCAIRPQVVSVSPLYDSAGVYRDRIISVMFDQPMDSSSIYYSESEQAEFTKSGYVLLKDSTRNNKCYGYWDGENESTIHFKNITITNRKNSNDNLLKHYQPPYFDEYDKSVLRIKPQLEAAASGGKKATTPPPESLDILVTINMQMSCSQTYVEKQKLVTLSSNYKWTYYTNGKKDSGQPVFGSFTLQFYNNQDVSNVQATYVDAYTALNKFDIDGSKPTDVSNYVQANLVRKEFWVKGGFSDGDSGPGCMKWVLYKVANEQRPYTTINESNITVYASGTMNDLIVEGQNAELKRKVVNENVTTYKPGIKWVPAVDLEDGIYKLDFIAYDNNENTSAPQSFYFLYDATSDVLVDQTTITNKRTQTEKETLTWTNPTRYDFENAIAECWDGNTKLDEKEISKGVTTVEFDCLTTNKKYTYKIRTKDIYGNESEAYTPYVDNTPPAKAELYGGGRNGGVKLFYNDPKDTEIALLEVYKNDSRYKSYTPDGNGTHNSTLFAASNGTTVQFTIKTTDYSGNVTESTIKEKAGVYVGDICYENYDRNEIFCSSNYHGGKDSNKVAAKGIICNVSDLTKVRVWDIKEESGAGYNWGENTKDTGDIKYDYDRACDGLLEYDYFKNSHFSQTFDYHHEGRKAVSDSDSYTYWYHIWKDSRSGTSLKWYIPGMQEINNVFCGNSNISVVSKMNTAVSTLSKNGVSATIRERGTLLITSTPSSDSAYYHLIKDNSILDNLSKISYEQTNKDYCYRDCRGNAKSRLHLMAQINLN